MSSKKESRPETVAACIYWLRRTAPRETVFKAFNEASWFYRAQKGEALNAKSKLVDFRRALHALEPALTAAYQKHLDLQKEADEAADAGRIALPGYNIDAEIAERFMTFVQAEYDRINSPMPMTGKR